MSKGEIVQRYYSSIRARDIDAFMALFASDATFTTPDGRQRVGAEAIRAMQVEVFASSNPPLPMPTVVISNDVGYAVQLNVRQRNGDIHSMASFFKINSDEKIIKLSIYRQGI